MFYIHNTWNKSRWCLFSLSFGLFKEQKTTFLLANTLGIHNNTSACAKQGDKYAHQRNTRQRQTKKKYRKKERRKENHHFEIRKTKQIKQTSIHYTTKNITIIIIITENVKMKIEI